MYNYINHFEEYAIDGTYNYQVSLKLDYFFNYEYENAYDILRILRNYPDTHRVLAYYINDCMHTNNQHVLEKLYDLYKSNLCDFADALDVYAVVEWDKGFAGHDGYIQFILAILDRDAINKVAHFINMKTMMYIIYLLCKHKRYPDIATALAKKVVKSTEYKEYIKYYNYIDKRVVPKQTLTVLKNFYDIAKAQILLNDL